ncbi:MAG TPA: DUF1080 domain-containing protein [Bryobacteraceae bacterium]|nr:DUF1080 domain-containing protein [Bryobacteraceae bacterium]
MDCRKNGGLCFLLVAALYAEEPQPRVVDPGSPGHAPSDAIVLFDGRSNSEWTHKDGRPAEWTVQDGVLLCKSGTGDIVSKRTFNSAQIHLEFSTPNMPQAHGQARGNSGVYIQGRYEVQVLDSYNNPTYPNGSAAAVYGQHPPLVNASRPPEQWQSYDFIFHAPRCGRDGKVNTPATLTLLHNGVLVQDHVPIKGNTPGSDEARVCEAGPILLQDHFHPDVKDTLLRFRNIWVRPLEPRPPH